MPAVAQYDPDMRRRLRDRYEARTYRSAPLLRHPRELAQAKKLGLIADAPEDPDTIPTWKTLADLGLGFALHVAFWALVLAPFYLRR